MTRPIIDALIKYNEENNIRFHMPGHKGQDIGYDDLNIIKSNLYGFDVTEVEGTDNLHSPESSIKLSQEEAAKSYGASESFYLVNGSTSGIYSMILSSANKGDKIIVQRNCHKSVYMASFIGELNLEYITPSVLDEFSFAAAVSVDDVKEAVEKNKDAKAIVITSPSYYGTCSDIEAISKITKKHNMLLLVDGAHGAHFPFSESLPSGNIALGADIEVVSPHKTLPSLTQTGLLNVSSNGSLVNMERLKFMLSIYQSSSPSYILMASIEAAMDIMRKDGEKLLNNVIEYISELKLKLNESGFYRILDSSYIGKSSIKDIDLTRLVISCKIGGTRLMEILRSKYSIQVEMADNKSIVIIGSVFDKRDYYERLYDSLISIENEFSSEKIEEYNKSYDILDYSYKGVMPIAKGYTLPKISINLEDSEGRVSGEMVAPYPPGIPILVPGEVITYNKILCIKNCKKLKIEVSGIEDKSLNTIFVIDDYEV